MNTNRYQSIFIFIIGTICPLINSLQVGQRFFIDDSIASELEDWEIRWLRDAVRRGRGFVSKEDDWDEFAKSIKQSQPSHSSHSSSHPIPAQEPSFLGSFDGSESQSAPVYSIDPSSGMPAFFGNTDPNMFLQPIVVQPPQPHPVRPQSRPFSRRITTSPPSTTTSSTTPLPRTQSIDLPEGKEIGSEEFKALANILNHLIGRRKEILASEGDVVTIPSTTTVTTTTTRRYHSRKSERPLPNIIMSPNQIAPSSKIFSDRQLARSRPTPPSPPGLPSGQWVMMNPEELDPEKEDHRIPNQLPKPINEFDDTVPIVSTHSDGDHDPEEEMFKELSNQLADLVNRMKKNKKKETKRERKPHKPKIVIIRNGTAEGLANRQYNLIATITLIRDGKTNILVDTGLATDINARTQMIRQGVPVPAISIVVSTHGHPDHAGNNHEFPDAIQYHGWFVHERTVFNLSNLFESERHELTPFVSLLRVPGHTSEDIAVLIRDAVNERGEHMGNVAVTGDVFIRREDIDNHREWAPLSADEKLQSIARRTLLCKSDWIVPGHGPPFPVDESLRRIFKC